MNDLETTAEERAYQFSGPHFYPPSFREKLQRDFDHLLAALGSARDCLDLWSVFMTDCTAAESARVSPDREALARRLFEHVFRKLQPRLDSKHTWEAADEATRQGFRDEIDAICCASLPPAVGEWREIDSAPKDGSEILVATSMWVATGFWGYRTGNNPLVKNWCGETWRGMDNDSKVAAPTHWMPKPAPPAPPQEKP